MQGEKIMKNKLIKKLLVLGIAFSLAMSACASQNVQPADNDTDIEEDEDDDRHNNEPDEEPPMYVPEEIDFSTSGSVLNFVKGSWDLIDLDTGEVYGVLEIDKSGAVSYTYYPTDVTVSGNLMFYEPFDKMVDGMIGYDLTLTGLEENFGCWIDEDTSGGRFRIAQSEGKDYMFFEELGNGGSTLGYEVLRSPHADEYGVMMRWLFTRDNDVNYIPNEETEGTFNAFVYERDPKNICLQQVDEVAFETYKEYTAFKYMGAYYDERKHPEAVWYPLASNADLNDVLSEETLNADHPITIYEVTISDGEITKMVQADRSEYGIYELYALDQDIEIDGDSFTINDCKYCLSDYGVETAGILDYEVFGDYLIMRADQGLHASNYVVYNMRTAWPEKTLSGCNFIHGDHVWDSYYTFMDTVYNYEGYPVATIDGWEINDLSFAGAGNSQLVISYWTDRSCTETAEETIDRPFSYNDPIYAFADYRHNPCIATWKEFMSYAPQGARMMIMINPPSDESWMYYQPEAVDGVQGLDYVYVIALQDNTFINLGSEEGYILNKGGIHCYSLTVPEAGTSITIHAETDDGESIWPVGIISGKEDIRFTFE